MISVELTPGRLSIDEMSWPIIVVSYTADLHIEAWMKVRRHADPSKGVIVYGGCRQRHECHHVERCGGYCSARCTTDELVALIYIVGVQLNIPHTVIRPVIARVTMRTT